MNQNRNKKKKKSSISNRFPWRSSKKKTLTHTKKNSINYLQGTFIKRIDRNTIAVSTQ